MVESKIYREVRASALIVMPSNDAKLQDELEREVEKYKEKAARASRKASKNSSESVLSMAPSSHSAMSNGHTQSQSGASSTTVHVESDADACEVCAQPGHDIFTCPILRDEKPVSHSGMGHTPSSSTATAKNSTAPSKLFCDDCENYGHVSADCPHSMDVF